MLNSVNNNWTATPPDGRRLGSLFANSSDSPFPIEDTINHLSASRLGRSLISKKLAPTLVKTHSKSTAMDDSGISFGLTFLILEFFLTLDDAWRKLDCTNNFFCSAPSFCAVSGSMMGKDNSLSNPPWASDLLT